MNSHLSRHCPLVLVARDHHPLALVVNGHLALVLANTENRALENNDSERQE
jgi:hypothetical protein